MASDWFDRRQVRHAFSRAAGHYDEAATLQRTVDGHLWESLDYLDDPAFYGKAPQVIVDAGSGTGRSAARLQERWPEATVLSVDAAMGMLKLAAPGSRLSAPRSWLLALRSYLTSHLLPLTSSRLSPLPVNADVRNLPFAEQSVDLIYSNLCLQWVEDLQGVLNGFRRVLKPGGMVLFSTLGPETLHELRHAFAVADDEAAHVSPFANIQHWGDALIATGFRNPVLDRDVIIEHHPDLRSLMVNLKTIGATNALQDRRKTLTGRKRFAAADAAYEAWREPSSGMLPATWEVIYAVAWAPNADAPIRENGVDVVKIPVDRIKVRTRTP